MLIGLQGSGKTTTAGKLARLLRSQGERVLLIAGDPYRPAAVQQIIALGEKLGVEVAYQDKLKPPEMIAYANKIGKRGGFSVMIMDTAGRSQIDQSLMNELDDIVRMVTPAETLLVVDAMTGQEALQIAEGFRKYIPISGLIMTKVDGDARGGAAISICSVTGIPIKFLGTGEQLDGLEKFDPTRVASRILGMGDILGLIEKAEAVYDERTAQKQAEKFLEGKITLEDWASQLKQMQKMGPIGQIMDMLPGQFEKAVRGTDHKEIENSIKNVEAIINSMTIQERQNPDILNASRRRRIASGSGTEVQDVNRMLRNFKDMQRLFKSIQKSGGRGLPFPLER
jgi:signal recognition particle subunit SRP54